MPPAIRIDRITVHHFRIPLTTPFRISSGELRTKEGVLIEGRSGDVTGWGEVAVDAIPFYTPETVGGALDVCRRVFGELVRSRAWTSPEELADAMDAFRGHHFAKAGLELMFWDILGKLRGEPVWKMLGGTREWVESGPSIGIKSEPAALVEAVARHVAEGARRIKVKVSPGFDTAYLDAVRAEFPDITLMVDANNAYQPSDMDALVTWDKYKLLMIEQPFDRTDLYYHVELCRRMETPVCLDESVESVHLADCALKMKAADIVNIKVGRVGGLVNAKRIHDMCAAAGVPVWIGSRIGTAVGMAMRLAAATLPNATLPTDAGFGVRYLPETLAVTPFAMHNGCQFKAPDAPGIGVAVDREALARYTVATEDV